MKKLTLALSAAVALAASGSVIAQDSGTLQVFGSVPAYCTVDIQQAGSIDLILNDWQKVGEVLGTCNSGLPTLVVRYTAQNGNSGGTAAAFVHDDGDAWIEFQGRVTPPGGTTEPFMVGLSPYDIAQLNGGSHDVEFNPAGVATDKAGNYQTDFLIEVFPN